MLELIDVFGADRKTASLIPSILAGVTLGTGKRNFSDVVGWFFFRIQDSLADFFLPQKYLKGAENAANALNIKFSIKFMLNIGNVQSCARLGNNELALGIFISNCLLGFFCTSKNT